MDTGYGMRFHMEGCCSFEIGILNSKRERSSRLCECAISTRDRRKMLESDEFQFIHRLCWRVLSEMMKV